MMSSDAQSSDSARDALVERWERMYWEADKNPEVALDDFVNGYAALDRSERAACVELAREWAGSDQTIRRHVSRALAREYRITDLVPALNAALAELEQRARAAAARGDRPMASEWSEDVRQTKWTLQGLNDESVWQERRRLRDAFAAYFLHKLPPEPARNELIRLHMRLDDYDEKLNAAAPLLSGHEANRKLFGPDDALESDLRELAASKDPTLSGPGQEYLEHYEICKQVHLAARDIRVP